MAILTKSEPSVDFEKLVRDLSQGRGKANQNVQKEKP